MLSEAPELTAAITFASRYGARSSAESVTLLRLRAHSEPASPRVLETLQHLGGEGPEPSLSSSSSAGAAKAALWERVPRLQL